MKKTIISYIPAIIKDMLIKACIYFSAMTIIATVVCTFIITLDVFAPSMCFIFAWVSLIAGAAAQIYRIKKLPAISRHIAFFILIYLDFIFMILLWTSNEISSYSMTSNSLLYLSVVFIAIYFVIFGIVMGIKAIVNSAKNKKLEYEKQFKNVE